MDKVDWKQLGMYLLLIVFLVFNITFQEVFAKGWGTTFLKPACWFLLTIYAIFIFKTGKIRARNKKDKQQIVIISLMIYFMIYFTSGLIIGYKNSPYAHSIFAIVSNLWKFIPVIIMQEYVRFIMVTHTKKRFWIYAIIVVLFVLLDLNFQSFFTEMGQATSAFKYVSSTILPLIFTNILLVYLDSTCGYRPAMIYRSSFELFYLLVPIFPDTDWFLTGMFQMLLPIVIFINITYIDERADRTLSNRVIKKKKPLYLIPQFFLFIVFVGFVAGFFKYKPIAVLSNSMVPVFSRGDLVIVEKISDKEKNNLKVGTIIEFEHGSATIMHRINRITEDEFGNRLYVTKGDNNNVVDSDKVKPSQVHSVIHHSVPLLGYPSVWLYEIFNKALSM